MVFDEHNVVQPDVVYVRPERRLHALRGDAVHGAPDLVVEVLSSSTRDRDLGAKPALYARFGVREYWVVDPAERVILRFTDPDGLRYRSAEETRTGGLASTVVPGSLLRCEELFGDWA